MKPRRITILGVEMDLGQDRRGVDLGPNAIRAAGLAERLRELGHDVVDGGNVPCPEPEEHHEAMQEDVRKGEPRFLDEVIAVCETLADRVEKIARDGRFPLVLGGDHSIAMGTMGGLARAQPKQGILYVDAHGDFNTHESTPSGNIHGMDLAAILGRGHPRLVKVGGVAPKAVEERVALLGIRSLDPGERRFLADAGVHVYTMRDIDERGMHAVMREALSLVTRGVKGLHVSMDMDSVDPLHAPGVGTPVPGGLTLREAHLLFEMLSECEKFTSLEIVEVNPLLDGKNQTGRLAVDLVASAMGKSIL